MIDFNNEKLIEKYGSWMRVQVAFYDFLFTTALNVCPGHFNELARASVEEGSFADGEEFYETQVKAITEQFPKQSDAWDKFISENTK